MPLANIPQAPTLAEMYHGFEMYRARHAPEELSAEEYERLRSAWYSGVGTLLSILLAVHADGKTLRISEHARAAAIEAWDAEIVDAAMATVMRNKSTDKPE